MQQAERVRVRAGLWRESPRQHSAGVDSRSRARGEQDRRQHLPAKGVEGTEGAADGAAAVRGALLALVDGVGENVGDRQNVRNVHNLDRHERPKGLTNFIGIAEVAKRRITVDVGLTLGRLELFGLGHIDEGIQAEAAREHRARNPKLRVQHRADLLNPRVAEHRADLVGDVH